MRFGVLGALEIIQKGLPTKVPGRRLGSLLAALLARAGHVVPQDELGEALWPESGVSRDLVQSNISRLRRQLGPLGPQVVVRLQDGYAIDTRERVDYFLFEELARRAAETCDSGRVEASVPVFREALALWRGSAFGEFGQDELVYPTAVRLEELRLSVYEQLVAAEFSLGRHGRVVGDLETLTEAHPFRERTWELRILALAHEGRQAEALRTYQKVRELLRSELGVEPSAPLQELEQLILTQDPRVAMTARPILQLATASTQNRPSLKAKTVDRNVLLPRDRTPFVGRDAEVDDILRLLDTTDLLTMVGFAGMGKTRLAIEVARRWAGGRDRAVSMIDLSDVVDPSEAESLVAGWLARRGDAVTGEALLLVDNCEHLIDSCAVLIDDVLDLVDGLRIIATSHEPLALPGETVWRVEPMTTMGAEATHEVIAESDVVRLFVQICRTARPELAFDDDDLKAAARICRWLDGIPLAVELAAGLVGTMSLEEIEAEHGNRFDLLQRGYRTAPKRQRTLAGAFDWSIERLSEREAFVLRQLAFFSSEFPRRAAEVICSSDPQEEADISVQLDNLVNRSLVQVVERSGRTTYRILPSIRQYLLADFPTDWVQQSTHYRSFVVQLAHHSDLALRGTPEQSWRAMLDGSTETARRTLDVAFYRHDLEAGSFLAGLAAAHTTSTGCVAFVGAVPGGQIARFESGYRQGVAHVDPDIRVVSTHISHPPDYSGFWNTGRAQQLTLELLAADADVVFHAAGHDGGTGVLEAARQWHLQTDSRPWVIGVDHDERQTRGRHLQKYILTSMRRQIPTNTYLDLKTAVAAGSLQAAPFFDAGNGGVGLATSGGQIDQLSPAVEQARAALVAGDITLRRIAPLGHRQW